MLAHSPNIVTNGLLLYYDMHNTQKSFKGQPTTNFVSAPEDLSNAVWDKTSYPTTITNNAIEAPTGTMTADLAVNANTSTSLYFQGISTTTTGTGQLTASVYAKYYSATYFTLNCFYNGDTEVNINFNLTTGTCDAGGTMSYVGNGWYLCSHQIPTRVNAGTYLLYRIWPGGRGLTNTLGCYFWGHQLEAKSYVTPYTPSSRSTTQTLIDLTGTTTITANSLTYDSNNTFSFNGSNYTSTTGLVASNQIAVQMMIKVSSNPGGFKGFIGGNDGTNNDYQIGFNIDMGSPSTASVITINIEGSGISYGNYMNDSIAFNQWFNLAVVISTTTTTLYINGVQQKSLARTSNASIARSFLTTGARPVTGSGQAASYAFTGSIGYAKVYNRTLTAVEVLQNFNALKGRFGL